MGILLPGAAHLRLKHITVDIPTPMLLSVQAFVVERVCSARNYLHLNARHWSFVEPDFRHAGTNAR
jgi:hypothetical protein